MEEKYSFAKNALLIVLAQIAAAGFGFLIRPLVARILGPTEYGVFALILGTAAVIPAFILLTLNGGLMYYAARERDLRTVGAMTFSVIAVMLALSLILFFPGFLAVGFFSPLGFDEYAVAFALAVGIAFSYVIQAIQQGLEKFKDYGLFTAASAILMGVGALALIFLKPAGVVASIGRIVGLSVALAFAFHRLGLPQSFSWPLLKKVFVYTAPLSVAYMIGTLMAVVDKYVIAFFHPPSEVGYYDIANALAISFLPLITALSTTMFPRVAKEESKLATYYEKVSLVTVLLTTVIALGLLYYSDIIVNILLGAGYVNQTSDILKIIALGIPLIAWVNLNTTTLNALGKTVLTGAMSVSLVILTIALNILLVPSEAGKGAAWAYFVSYLILCAAGGIYLAAKKATRLNASVKQVALFFVFAAAFIFLRDNGFFAKTAGFALFAAVTFLLNKKTVFETINQIVRTASTLVLRRGEQ